MILRIFLNNIKKKLNENNSHGVYMSTVTRLIVLQMLSGYEWLFTQRGSQITLIRRTDNKMFIRTYEI